MKISVRTGSAYMIGSLFSFMIAAVVVIGVNNPYFFLLGVLPIALGIFFVIKSFKEKENFGGCLSIILFIFSIGILLLTLFELLMKLFPNL